MNSYTHTGATNILFTNERNTKVIGIRGISSNNSSSSIYEGDIYIPSSPEYTKIVQKSCLVLNIRKSYKSRVFQPIAREEPKACATSRKVLGLGNIFPLPSSTTSNHPIFRRLVRWTPARLTRIYVMMHSSALGEGQVRISYAIHRQVVCDLAEPSDRLRTWFKRCAIPQEVRNSGKIRDGRYLFFELFGQASGRDEDVIQAFPCLIA
jgi:hypothetical protein